MPYGSPSAVLVAGMLLLVPGLAVLRLNTGKGFDVRVEVRKGGLAPFVRERERSSYRRLWRPKRRLRRRDRVVDQWKDVTQRFDPGDVMAAKSNPGQDFAAAAALEVPLVVCQLESLR